MAEKVQINPLITASTREELRQVCLQRGLSQGDIVEAALLAFLAPVGETGRGDIVAQRLTAIEEALQALAGIVAEVFTPPEVPKEPPSAPTTSIATYEQMYGPIVPATPAIPAPVMERPRRKGLRRWLLREEHV